MVKVLVYGYTTGCSVRTDSSVDCTRTWRCGRCGNNMRRHTAGQVSAPKCVWPLPRAEGQHRTLQRCLLIQHKAKPNRCVYKEAFVLPLKFGAPVHGLD